MVSSPPRRASCPSRSRSLVCRIPITLLGLSETNTIGYVRQLEQAYDATGEAASRPRREDDFNPEQLMHELEDFLRQERDRGAE
jgi:hypothetical protein